MISIGDLAARVGVSTAAVRYYEREGVMAAPPRKSGRRVYGEEDVLILRLVVVARQAGFGIAALRSLAPVVRDSGSRRTILKASIDQRLRDIDDEVERLRIMRFLLATAVACDCTDLRGCRTANETVRS